MTGDAFPWSDSWSWTASGDPPDLEDGEPPEGWREYISGVISGKLHVGATVRAADGGLLRWTLGVGWSGDLPLVSYARRRSEEGATVGVILCEVAGDGYIPSTVALLMDEYDTYG